MNLPTSLLPLIAALLLSSSTLATDTQQLFTQLDQNQDGSLQADEIAPEHQRLFQRLLRTSDSDQDQKLSSTEFQRGLKPSTPEKPIVKKYGSRMPGADALLLLLAKMDANADRKIEADEVPAQFREFFAKIEDQLGGESDGVLNQREITQAAPRLSQLALRIAKQMDIDVELELAMLPKKQWEALQKLSGAPQRGEYLADPEQALEIFARLDADDDGQVTAAEVPNQIAARFEQLLERADRNRDDQLSEQELLAFSKQLKRLEANRMSPAQKNRAFKRLLKQFDKNNDKQISRDEAPQRMASRFDRLDSDGNGQLNREELTPVVELLSRLRPTEDARKQAEKPKMLPEK